MNKTVDDGKVDIFGVRFWIIFTVFFIFICLVLSLPYFLTQYQFCNFDFKKIAPIGETLGGILGPFIAIAAAILTFLAFWVQYIANEQQRRDLKIERFENKFYQLIQIHRNNVSDTVIGKSTAGRKAFIAMYQELKFTYLIIKNHQEANHVNDNISPETIYNISYLIFFFGVGPNSTRIVLDLVEEKHKDFFFSVERYLQDIQNAWKTGNKILDGFTGDENDMVNSLFIPYKPFNGHTSKISHYLRHIFQIVKFVDAEYPYESYEAKYNYIATLRAQLSTHEQLLIYYNALSCLGKPWLESAKNGEHYLKKYCVIKSMPLPLANFYKLPSEIFGSGKKNVNGKLLFEWDEIKNRLNEII